jgi:hypothetical protein
MMLEIEISSNGVIAYGKRLKSWGKFMPKQVNIWAPILKGDSEPMMSLAVPCGEKAPNTKEQYRMYLEDHLTSEILSNPKRSKEEMQAMGNTSEESNPDLSAIPVEYPPHQWGALILQLDQMGMLLSQIDWQKDNPPRSLSDKNLPSLMDVLQML